MLSFSFKKSVFLNIENKTNVNYEYWVWVKDHEDLQYNQIKILNSNNKIYKEDVNEIQLEIISNKQGCFSFEIALDLVDIQNEIDVI